MTLYNKILTLTLLGYCFAAHSYADTLSNQFSNRLGSSNSVKINPQVNTNALTPVQFKTDQSTNKVAANRIAIFSNPTDAILGNPKGTRQFAVFVDPYCSHCRKFQVTINAAISDMADLRIVMKDFPMFGEASVNAIKVLKAAQQQGKYIEMQALIHQQDDSLTMPQLLVLAEKIDGLDTKQLAKAVTQGNITTAIANTVALADKLGIDATPMSIVGFKIIPGDIELDDLKKMLQTPGLITENVTIDTKTSTDSQVAS